MKNLSTVVALFFLFTSCGNLKQIENVSGSTIPNGLSEAQVAEAIKEGASLRGWNISETEGAKNSLDASILSRGRKVAVTISYSAKSYDIAYKDSENMKYSAEESKVHKKYYKWVYNLRRTIGRALKKKANE